LRDTGSTRGKVWKKNSTIDNFGEFWGGSCSDKMEKTRKGGHVLYAYPETGKEKLQEGESELIEILKYITNKEVADLDELVAIWGAKGGETDTRVKCHPKGVK